MRVCSVFILRGKLVQYRVNVRACSVLQTNMGGPQHSPFRPTIATALGRAQRDALEYIHTTRTRDDTTLVADCGAAGVWCGMMVFLCVLLCDWRSGGYWFFRMLMCRAYPQYQHVVVCTRVVKGSADSGVFCVWAERSASQYFGSYVSNFFLRCVHDQCARKHLATLLLNRRLFITA